MLLSATGRLKDVCYRQQGVIIFIVQNKLVLCFYSAGRQFDAGIVRRFTTYSGVRYTAIGMTERQLLIALIVIILHILVYVMQV